MFFLISAEVYAQNDILKNPSSIESLKVVIIQSGIISSEGRPTHINVNLTIPQDNENQVVETDVKREYDLFGNKIGVIEQENPGNYFMYDVKSTVLSKAYHLYDLPKTYTILDDVKMYLKPTENIQSNDPRIKSIAENVVKNAKDDFEKVAYLAIWVNNYITYDPLYANKTLDAISVFEKRRGVCSEYTTLFTAMARSLGIPTRYVSAFSYGKYGWERHAYAEVWIGKWIPVDVLWLEVGYLDATHIKFGHYLDNQIKNEVRVEGENVKNIKWVEDHTDITAIDYKTIEKESNYNLYLSSDVFREGYEGVAVLEFTPKEYMAAQFDLEPCIGQHDVVFIENRTKNVIAKPGEKKIVYWKFSVKSDLPDNYIFRCPLTLNSRSLDVRAANVTVNTELFKKTNEIVEVNLDSNRIEFGDKQKVYVNVKNLESPIKIGIIAEDEIKEWDVKKDGKITFEFVPKNIGEQNVIVYTSDGKVFDLPYTVSSDIKMDFNITLKDAIKVNEVTNLTVFITSKSNLEKIARLHISFDNKDVIENIAIRGNYVYSTPVSFSTTDFKIVKVRVDDIEKSKVIEVYDDPVIFYETKYDGKRSILILNVTRYKAKDIVITIGDATQKIEELFGSRELYFNIPSGKYTMKISYKDASGASHGTEKEIEFKQSGIFEIIAQFFQDLIDVIKALFK